MVEAYSKYHLGVHILVLFDGHFLTPSLSMELNVLPWNTLFPLSPPPVDSCSARMAYPFLFSSETSIVWMMPVVRYTCNPLFKFVKEQLKINREASGSGTVHSLCFRITECKITVTWSPFVTNMSTRMTNFHNFNGFRHHYWQLCCSYVHNYSSTRLVELVCSVQERIQALTKVGSQERYCARFKIFRPHPPSVKPHTQMLKNSNDG